MKLAICFKTPSKCGWSTLKTKQNEMKVKKKTCVVNNLFTDNYLQFVIIPIISNRCSQRYGLNGG